MDHSVPVSWSSLRGGRFIPYMNAFLFFRDCVLIWELRDGPLSLCTLELPEDQGGRFIPYMNAFLFFRDHLLIWELRDGPLSPCTLELHEDQGTPQGRRFIIYMNAFLFFRDCVLIWYRAEGWTTKFLHPGAPCVVGGSYPTWMLSCFSGIIYSFGIELRDGPLSSCTLELPDWWEVHTLHECFLVW